MSKIFSVTESLDAQMKRFQGLRETNEELFREMFILGEKLTECASNGQLRKFQNILYEADQNDILLYFVVKMLQSALIAGHLLMAGFIIDNGYPVGRTDVGLPSCLHEAMRVVDDYRACAIIEFLIGKYMIDINLQVRNYIKIICCNYFVKYIYIKYYDISTAISYYRKKIVGKQYYILRSG